MCKFKMFVLQDVKLAEVAVILFKGYGLLRKKVSSYFINTESESVCIVYCNSVFCDNSCYSLGLRTKMAGVLPWHSFYVPMNQNMNT